MDHEFQLILSKVKPKNWFQTFIQKILGIKINTVSIEIMDNVAKTKRAYAFVASKNMIKMVGDKKFIKDYDTVKIYCIRCNENQYYNVIRTCIDYADFKLNFTDLAGLNLKKLGIKSNIFNESHDCYLHQEFIVKVLKCVTGSGRTNLDQFKLKPNDFDKFMDGFCNERSRQFTVIV